MKARTLIPPHRDAQDAPPPPAELYVEPTEDLLVLGEMLHDLDTMHEMLRKLPFDREHYRGNLRIVLGAAIRTKQRCERLLGEAPTAAEIEGAIDRLADAIVEQLDKPEASNKLDAHGIEDEDDPDFPPTSDEVRAADAGSRPDRSKKPVRGRSTAVPIEGGIKAAIVRELREGPKTSTELIEVLTKDSGVRPGAIHEALAKMRVAKEVTHQQMGRQIINRLA